MTKNNRFALKYRRRREGRTNYKKRLELLKSRKPRLVVRKTNAHMLVQVVSYTPDGDVVLAQATTKELVDSGWKAATSNLPAAYLAGYLAGVRAQKASISEAILDLGMQKAAHGGRLFAAVKGVLDAGVSVPVREEVLPSEERVLGAHIDEKLSKTIEAVKKKVGA